MRSIVTDGVAWSVCLSVGRSVNLEPCKNGWTDRDAVWGADSGDPKEPCIGGVQVPPREWVILKGGTLSARQMADWKSKISNSSTTGIWAREKRRTKWISVAGNCVEKWQNMMYISCLTVCQSTNFLNVPRKSSLFHPRTNTFPKSGTPSESVYS